MELRQILTITYILGGYTLGGIDNNTSNGTQDGFLIKYNSDGDKE